ncbi:MAG TPA: anti-sigma factor [Stellaceae bacterium]|nr:anti-sigma factor [Stellaceae bacterium]
MIPDDPEELHILAGEYVLGVTGPEAAREIEDALAGNDALARAVAFWQERLHPLSDLAAPAEPPPALWQKIESGLAGAAPARPRPWNSIVVWRWSTAAASAVAAGLALYIALAPPAAAPSYVAVLHAPQQADAAFVATGGRNGLLLRAVARESPPGDRGFELWAIPAGAKPQSLGIIPPDGRVELGRLPLPLKDGMTLAISIEPKTGSPTGQPTGPVVFVGTLVAAD